MVERTGASLPSKCFAWPGVSASTGAVPAVSRCAGGLLCSRANQLLGAEGRYRKASATTLGGRHARRRVPDRHGPVGLSHRHRSHLRHRRFTRLRVRARRRELAGDTASAPTRVGLGAVSLGGRQVSAEPRPALAHSRSRLRPLSVRHGRLARSRLHRTSYFGRPSEDCESHLVCAASPCGPRCCRAGPAAVGCEHALRGWCPDHVHEGRLRRRDVGGPGRDGVHPLGAWRWAEVPCADRSIRCDDAWVVLAGRSPGHGHGSRPRRCDPVARGQHEESPPTRNRPYRRYGSPRRAPVNCGGCADVGNLRAHGAGAESEVG